MSLRGLPSGDGRAEVACWMMASIASSVGGRGLVDAVGEVDLRAKSTRN